MPSWNADQYLRFAAERTRPSHDLVQAIAVEHPLRVVDLGCGPGNSTRVLIERWPDATVSGIDSAAAMIEAARREDPARNWKVGDIAAWAAEDGPEFDVVYSNAALQWVPDHATVYPRLLRRVAPGGALAIQVPMNLDAPAHRAMREIAASPEWSGYYPPSGVREWHVHDAAFYYDLLAGAAARIDLWQTEYLHVLEGAEAVVAWYKGTGLRPFLDPLPTDDLRGRFETVYLERIRPLYPERPDGKVLFPFQRLFLVAYR
jgi:trans-aconitate 2-methyltransferase